MTHTDTDTDIDTDTDTDTDTDKYTTHRRTFSMNTYDIYVIYKSYICNI